MVRKGLFILYGIVNLLTAYAIYESFRSQNENQHVVMNLLAYFLAPIFFAICTVVAFVVLFITNRVEKKANTYQFSVLTKLAGISLFIGVILHCFRTSW